MRIRHLVPLATAATLAVSLGTAALASSSGLQAVGAHPVLGGQTWLSRHALATMNSKDLAGYSSTASGLTHVNLTTTYAVPAIKCGSVDKAVAPFVAASSTSSGTSAAGVFVGCKSGKARYYPIFSVNDVLKTYPSAAAHPGDKVVLRENWNSRKVSLSVVDKTRPAVSKALTGSGASSFSLAVVGDSPFNSLPIPNFGTVRFSNSILDGHAFRLAPGLSRVNMVNSSMTLQIKTSRLASDGESFKTIFAHS